MELSRADHVSRLLDQRLILTNQWVKDLGSFLLKHYWVTSQTMQILRRRPTEQYGEDQHFNEFNVQPQVVPSWLQEWLENRGGYLIFSFFIKTFRPFVFLRTWSLLSDSANAEWLVNSTVGKP